MKTIHRHIGIAVISTALAVATSVAQAQTFRFANQGDALSMHPHSLNESHQVGFDQAAVGR